MRYRPLGRTGINVSAVSLGTVSLGVEYGIDAPGEFGRPDEASALRLLREAVDRGVTLIDTAPTYGESEQLVGRAVAGDPRVIVATKVTPPVEFANVRASIDASLEASRRALNRDRLDIVQVHNATCEMIRSGEVTDALLEAKRRGVVRLVGASVYGEQAALAVVRSGQFDVLQVAFNALDQRMAARVLPEAHAAGVGVLVRSAFLKGALTPKAQWLPPPLAPLRHAAERVRDLLAGGAWAALPEAAMRYCLSVPHVSSVLSGARTMAELTAAIDAEAADPLSNHMLARAAELALTDERLLNPSHWPLP